MNSAELSLGELRAERNRLQDTEDAVSYVRRLTQARLDLVRAEQARRAGEANAELGAVLGAHLTASGPPRPPRPTQDHSTHPLAAELEVLCAEHGAADPADLGDAELAGYAAALESFEQHRSAERRELFGRIDALSAELVRRYRDGEATVDSLLGKD